jgi:hypothetical protein
MTTPTQPVHERRAATFADNARVVTGLLLLVAAMIHVSYEHVILKPPEPITGLDLALHGIEFSVGLLLVFLSPWRFYNLLLALKDKIPFGKTS